MRRVLILGATSAIAQETARLFAAAGDSLFVVGRNAGKLEAVASDLCVRGAASVGSMACDLNDCARHEEILGQAVAHLNGLDTALVAHGVLGGPESFREFAATELVMRTNLLSVVSLLTLIGNYMEEQRHGSIAAISSVAGDRGRQSNYVYGASKGGLNVFLQGMRNRMHPAGVRVLTVKPGFVDTPMTEHMKKSALFAPAAEVGRAIHRGILRGQDVIYVPWYWRWVMFAVRAVPEGAFKRLRL